MKNFTFEEFLQEKFMDEREIGGIPIIKDNAEDLFDRWLESLDVQQLIDYADEALQQARVQKVGYELQANDLVFNSKNLE